MTTRNFIHNRPQTRLALFLLIVLSVGVTAAIYTGSVSANNQDIAKLNRFIQSKGSAASGQTFREGRDFIESKKNRAPGCIRCRAGGDAARARAVH